MGWCASKDDIDLVVKILQKKIQKSETFTHTNNDFLIRIMLIHANQAKIIFHVELNDL